MSSNRICMSANCANPEAAMKFMNEFYDSEVSVEVLFGGISDGCLEKTGDDSYKVLDHGRMHRLRYMEVDQQHG